MTYRDKALDNPLNWSFHVGRIFAIDIRVHIAFVLCAVILVWMEIPKGDSGIDWSLGSVLVEALGMYAILFGIVLLHEFGHCFGARRTGGEADEILLWPLGGLASVNPPHNARAHMITTVAGPAVNVVICGICSLVLVLWLGSLGAVPWNPLHPFLPVGASIYPTTAQHWLLRVYGISYFILLINLLPIFPFDGGRIVQAWLWPRKGFESSMMIATGTGMIGAIIIGLVAIFQKESWILLMIAVFGYVTCWQQRKILKEMGPMEAGFGADYSTGYTFGGEDEAGERKPGFFARRRARKLALRLAGERTRREERVLAVEEALRQVSVSGLASLTPKQRRLLEEETQRQRAAETSSSNSTPP